MSAEVDFSINYKLSLYKKYFNYDFQNEAEKLIVFNIPLILGFK